MLMLIHSSSNVILSPGQRRRAKTLSWVILAETFLAMMACSYITLMCFAQPGPEREALVQMEGNAGAGVVPATPATQMTEVALAATWTGVSPEMWTRPDHKTSAPEKDECKPERRNTVGNAAAAFVVAFMAGGFMNLERIQGLPFP